MQARRYHIRTDSASERRSERKKLTGSAHVSMLAIVLIVFVAGGYLYTVNQNAVQGYHMRALEKEIDTLKEQNAELRISEADLRSLYRIAGSEETLKMQKFDDAVYLEERGTIALR